MTCCTVFMMIYEELYIREGGGLLEPHRVQSFTGGKGSCYTYRYHRTVSRDNQLSATCNFGAGILRFHPETLYLYK